MKTIKTNKLDLRRGEKLIALLNLRIYYTWKTLRTHIISAPAWINKFELADGSYSVSDIEEIFWAYLKKTWGKCR